MTYLGNTSQWYEQHIFQNKCFMRYGSHEIESLLDDQELMALNTPNHQKLKDQDFQQHEVYKSN